MQGIPLTTLSLELIKMAAEQSPAMFTEPEMTAGFQRAQGFVDRANPHSTRNAALAFGGAGAGIGAGVGALGGGAYNLLRRLFQTEQEKEEQRKSMGTNMMVGAGLGAGAGGAYGGYVGAASSEVGKILASMMLAPGGAALNKLDSVGVHTQR